MSKTKIRELLRKWEELFKEQKTPEIVFLEGNLVIGHHVNSVEVKAIFFSKILLTLFNMKLIDLKEKNELLKQLLLENVKNDKIKEILNNYITIKNQDSDWKTKYVAVSPKNTGGGHWNLVFIEHLDKNIEWYSIKMTGPSRTIGPLDWKDYGFAMQIISEKIYIHRFGKRHEK